MKCPKCEMEIVEGIKKCPECGFPFEENTAQENDISHEENKTSQMENDNGVSHKSEEKSVEKFELSVDETVLESTPDQAKKKLKKSGIIRTACEVIGVIVLIVSWTMIVSNHNSVAALTEENSNLSEQYNALQVSYTELSGTNDELKVQLEEQEIQIAEQEAQIAELENGADSQLVAVKNAYEAGDWQTVIDLTAELHNQYNGSDEDMEAQELAAQAQTKLDEEAAAAAEKEAQGYETGITYDQLARTPDDYIGEKVKFYGRVVQVIEGDSVVQIRLAVNDDYDTVLFGQYESSTVSSRVLEDDYITIYGTSVGTISYESTLGGTITIPGVYIEKIDQ